MSASRSGTVESPVTVYGRPGCPLCARLRFGLRRARINTCEVNIWDDPDVVVAASFGVDAFGYHDVSWALDGIAVAVYAAFTRWR